MMLKRILLLIFFFSGSFSLYSQALERLNLFEAYKLLEQNYPALKNDPLIDQMLAAQKSILDINKKPQLFLRGEGRLQSQSVQLEAPSDNFPIDINQPLVNVKSYLEANYNLIDAGLNEAKNKMLLAEAQVEHQKVRLDRFALKRSINQLFIQISLLSSQEPIFTTSLKDLALRKEKIRAGLDMGILLESELRKLEVKELELRADIDEQQFSKLAAIKVLSHLIGKELSIDLILEYPQWPSVEEINQLNRPELELFKLQKAAILSKADLIDVEGRPQLNLFAQAGIGYPNPLNLLDNGVAPYGLIGLGFAWKIKDWDKAKTEKSLLQIQAQKLIHAEETFVFNLDKQKSKYLVDLQALEKQIQNAEKIAVLQTEILSQMADQLDGAVISSSDYLIQVNAELLARQKLALFQTQYLKVHLEFWNERGLVK